MDPVRDCIGDSSVVGDLRWSGSFGVTIDFVAQCHCSVEIIEIEDIKVCASERKAWVDEGQWQTALFYWYS